ncbi:MAG: glycosyltransferase family 2 protein [Gemmatimonadota bacterium]
MSTGDRAPGPESFHRPGITVVVATYNVAQTIERCIDSIANQDHEPLELIVVDGGSTDGTVQLLESCAARITHWQTGPDEGVYDAFNKAIEQATGSYVCFLGADDYLAHERVVSRLVEPIRADAEVDFVSGRVAVVDANHRVTRLIGKSWKWNKLKRYMCVAHPASLCRTDLIRDLGGFSLKYRIAGDYDLLIRAGRDLEARFVNEVMAYMADEGLSNVRPYATMREVFRIQADHPEIGYVLAIRNWILALAKRIVIRLRTWSRWPTHRSRRAGASGG